VRVALGVGRGRLVSQVLTEVLVLSAAGGLIGLLLAAQAGPLIRNLLLPDIQWQGDVLNLRVLGFAFAAVSGAALLAGLVPALYTAHANVAALMRSGGRTETGRRGATRRILVVAQAALCVMLLIGAGLFVRSLHNAQATELGFDAHRTVAIDLNTWATDLPQATANELHETALEQLAALPGVEGRALAISTPFQMRLGVFFRTPGVDSLPRGADGGPYVAYVTPEYFSVMGIRVLRGRGFADTDTEGAEGVTILTERLARELFGGADALGRCLHFGREQDAPCITVVGVVNDVRFTTVDGEPTLQLFIPLAQSTNRSARSVVVRASGSAAPLLPRIREIAQRLHPALPLVNVELLYDRAEPQIRPWRMAAILFSLFGALALVLAAVGLYSVIAYDVVQRRQEFGLRIALGAGAPHLLRLILSDAGRMAVPGLLLGLTAAFMLGGTLEPVLYGVGPHDTFTFASVAVALLLVAAAAALVPARRAARVSPVEAMRME
jgi:predicted permease